MKVKYSLFIFFLLVIGQSFSQNRVALVIGAQSYTSSPLQNSLKDARDMAAVLRNRNFQVIELYDPKTKKEIKEAVLKYFDLMMKTDGGAGLLYYSGHGMQIDGVNYLVPTLADPKVKADVEEECLRLDYIMAVLEQAGNSLNILILDACRNNPFKSFTRSAEKGLSMVNSPKGSYIVYATKPGSVASDGTGGNGLFTSKLLKYIQQPNLKLEEVFKLVVRDVAAESDDSQRPWIASDYAGDFYFTTTQDVNQNNAEPQTEMHKQEELANQNKVIPSEQTSNKPKVDISKVDARVRIYRPSTTAGVVLKCEVFLDSKYIGTMENKGRLELNHMKYGLYRLSFKFHGVTKSIDISVADSNDIYIRWIDTGPQLVDSESGKKSFESLKKPVVKVN